MIQKKNLIVATWIGTYLQTGRDANEYPELLAPIPLLPRGAPDQLQIALLLWHLFVLHS